MAGSIHVTVPQHASRAAETQSVKKSVVEPGLIQGAGFVEHVGTSFGLSYGCLPGKVFRMLEHHVGMMEQSARRV